MYKLRPTALSLRYKLKYKINRTQGNPHFLIRRTKPVSRKPVNYQTIGNIFAKLHYLACHAPTKIQLRWKGAYLRFEKHHFGVWKRQSGRFHNKYTAGAWL